MSADRKYDGGPAFPRPLDPYPNLQGNHHEGGPAGMTLRDWFAGQALAAIIVNGAAANSVERAKDAYTHADAMIEERAK